jgi:tetrapyrrole methylase family protein/MazG family protein
MITLIGLGPADAGGMSVAARNALRAAPRLFVRTARHPAIKELERESLAFESFDSLYDRLESFDAVYDAIAHQIIEAAKTGEVAFAVPGHPLVAEESVRRILSLARDAGIQVRVVGSASFIEPTLSALSLSLNEGLLLLDALSLQSTALRPDIGTLLYQIYDRETASAAKLALMEQFPDEWEVSVVRSAGVPGEESIENIPLFKLDRVEVNHLTVAYVPPLPPEQRKKQFSDLVYVMARLRGEGGCPWDREQDHQTLKKYMVEECYEAIEAIDNDDLDALCEELGDVLLQVVFHAQLEAEVGMFTVDDVIARIVDKLIRRHPHVFGDLSVEDSDEVLRNWEQIKKSEKGEGWRKSALDGVPVGLPALMRAMEISKRAVKVGFEWEKMEDVLAKMEEEVHELRQALTAGNKPEIESEIGDLLFTVVNVARWQKVDPEEALRRMVNRFSDRFRYIEEAAVAQGRSIQDLTLAQMDALWEEAKKRNS